MFDNNDTPAVPTSSTALAIIPKTSTALAIRYDLVIDSPQSDTAEIADIVVQIRNWRLRGREYRIVTGELLIRLHKLLAKPGSGSFMRYVREECCLPYIQQLTIICLKPCKPTVTMKFVMIQTISLSLKSFLTTQTTTHSTMWS
jgi:hypothetical protein